MANTTLNWVTKYLSEHPADRQALGALGIHDETSYQDREPELEREVRQRTGRFRTYHILGAKCNDPCEFVRAAPGWLGKRKLHTLHLPFRAWKAFKSKGLETVYDIADRNLEELASLRGVGEVCRQKILQALKVALDSGPYRNATEEALLGSGRLLTTVRNYLQQLTGREGNVLIHRLGFETKQKSLLQLGKEYGVTREAIRRTETIYFQKWMKITRLDDALDLKISRVLADRTTPLALTELEVLDPWFEGMSPHPVLFKNLLRALCRTPAFLLQIDGQYYLARINLKRWQLAVSEAAKLLLFGAERQWSENYSRSLVQGLLPEKALELGAILWKKVSQPCLFSDAEPRILMGHARGKSQIIKSILAESEVPLHYKEITRRIKRIKGVDQDPEVARSIISKIAYRLGPGIYGLSHHVPLTSEQMARVRRAGEKVVSSGLPEKIWTTAQILKKLPAEATKGLKELDQHVLHLALSESKELKRFQRRRWMAADCLPSPRGMPSAVD